ncbi:YvrJ family protein [Pontibacillus yanchengensis]|uniref:YvrJ family protein n=1 Tax=Pontibacillus yanchengensis TaxID=462910 RepID=UPI000A04A981|nr:YvrJ family protein [Pontibacillus yanchengensis]
MNQAPIVDLIANTGFPIGVAVYLLVRIEKKIENLDKAIQSLTDVVSKNDY